MDSSLPCVHTKHSNHRGQPSNHVNQLSNSDLSPSNRNRPLSDSAVTPINNVILPSNHGIQHSNQAAMHSNSDLPGSHDNIRNTHLHSNAKCLLNNNTDLIHNLNTPSTKPNHVYGSSNSPVIRRKSNDASIDMNAFGQLRLVRDTRNRDVTIVSDRHDNYGFTRDESYT